MASESDENAVVEVTPKRKFGPLPMIVASVLLAIALIVGVVGGIVSYQSAKTLRTELAAVKKELKELKDAGQQNTPEDHTAALEAALKDMKLQVETLTKQIGALMASVAEHAGLDESAPPTVTDAKASGPKGGGTQKNGKQPDARDPAKHSDAGARKNDARSCDLIGKSPEEQAAIMKRCVSLIDPPNEKGAPSP